ncbi:hypothetical protein PIROE2DRAFT_18371 [Piromyces sp. E2]|nr:hypothetical protein PIROE2DRAFT_18371 [Piromyces sp. E2]|eukprot:OUM56850.1 hypothetical protein PIROE2DRAFT_18371 [Piromyces sp. E2]
MVNDSGSHFLPHNNESINQLSLVFNDTVLVETKMALSIEIDLYTFTYFTFKRNMNFKL